MQQDRQENAESRQRSDCRCVRALLDAGPQGDALGDRVDGQAESDAGHATGADRRRGVPPTILQGLRFIAEIVLVKLENTLQGDHENDAQRGPEHAVLDILGAGYPLQSMRQQVKQCNSQDKARNQAHDDLRAGVRQCAENGQTPSQHRRDEYRRTVDRK